VVRPVKELKGFCKNFIKAGDKITVSFSIDEKMLEFYRGDLKKVAEKGVFKIYIGANSDTQSYVEITLL
jgi:beta-glucosidase